MFEIHVKREFDAAHFLCSTETKCDQLHGHRWTVVVTFSSTQLTKSGWVVNFTTAKRWIDDVLEKYDHNILNFYLPQPTAENLCVCLWYVLAEKMTQYRSNHKTDVQLGKVEIYETPGNSASFSLEGMTGQDLRNLCIRKFWDSSDADPAKAQRSQRMRDSNPMKDRQVVERMIASLRKAQNLSPNKEEQRVIELFAAHGIPLKFVGDGKVIIDGKIPDFINQEKMVIVEYNNRFWHSDGNPWYDGVHDDSEERAAFFAERGYRTYFIWDDKLEADPDGVIEEIREMLR